MANPPIYITGNQNKAGYLARILGVELEYYKLTLDEIQSVDPLEVIEPKVKQPYELLCVVCQD